MDCVALRAHTRPLTPTPRPGVPGRRASPTEPITSTLAGTPDAGTDGTYTFTVTASNGVSPDATQTFTLTVSAVSGNNNSSNTTGQPLVAVAFAPNGEEVVLVVFQDGRLARLDSGGSHDVGANVANACLVFAPTGEEIAEVVYQDATFFQVDSGGDHLGDLF